MRITVIGTGYVGLIAGLCFADFGNNVTCLDKDAKKISMLQAGKCPIYEIGAEELLERNRRNERIKFTTNPQDAIGNADVVVIAVGTPETQTGEADLSYVFEAAKEIGSYAEEYTVAVDKSTVPVGTARKVKKIIDDEIAIRNRHAVVDVVSNPEFLREGKAVGDFLNPDRIIIGSDSKRATEAMQEIYKVFKRSNKPVTITTPETAEMIKYASNAFLATKIAFINEMSQLCENVGANVLEVAKAMGQDGRISPKFLHPGPGYGGSCFPKDTKAIARTAREYGINLSIVESVIASNEHQKIRCAQKIISQIKEGKICVLGVSFKPDTDDVRESPALKIIDTLLGEKHIELNIYDPQAANEGKKYFGDNDRLCWCENPYDAVKDVEAVVIVTEWLEFRNLDISKVAKLMHGNLFFDFRNIYSREDIEEYGLKYFGTGVS